MIRWGLAGQIVAAWVITIPATILAGAVVYWILDLVL